MKLALGLLHGVWLGVLVAVIAILWKQNVGLGLVLGLAMLGNMVIAGLGRGRGAAAHAAHRPGPGGCFGGGRHDLYGRVRLPAVSGYCNRRHRSHSVGIGLRGFRRSDISVGPQDRGRPVRRRKRQPVAPACTACRPVPSAPIPSPSPSPTLPPCTPARASRSPRVCATTLGLKARSP